MSLPFPLRAAAALLLALPACSLAPAHVRPEAPVPPLVTEAGAEDLGEAQYRTGWREFFKDPRLHELIALSLEQNRDLRLAALAVAEARARYGLQRAERLLLLNAEGSGAYSGKFQPPSETENYEAAGKASFDLDLFGRLKNLSESARQTYLATREAQKAVKIGLVAEVARDYLAERLAAEGL
ncbi:MAG: TolC family protein, partial [Desulfovibrio sp.]|nr:TolC family protein [Desulfovibrio sp.]